MKHIFLLVLISFLFVNAYSQKKMTGRELAGLKGNVKSVLVETAFLEINQKKYNPENRIRESEDFYDLKGNIKNNPNKSEAGESVKYVFDRRGRIFEERKIDASGFQYARNVYKYNPKGQISEQTYYLFDKLVANIFYTYDADGNLTEMKFVPTKENIIQDTVIQLFKEYKFDAFGNWIQRTVETTSVLDGQTNENLSISYRKIEYFN